MCSFCPNLDLKNGLLIEMKGVHVTTHEIMGILTLVIKRVEYPRLLEIECRLRKCPIHA